MSIVVDTARVSTVNLRTFLGEFKVDKFGLEKDSFYVGHECFFCDEKVQSDDTICLVPTRPHNEEEQIRMMRGLEYVCRVEPAHWTCMVEFVNKLKETNG